MEYSKQVDALYIHHEPDFLVRLASDVTLVLEVKGFEDNQTKAKHDAAKRWVMAVNNWGQLSRWDFHVCRNPLLLGKELTSIVKPRMMGL